MGNYDSNISLSKGKNQIILVSTDEYIVEKSIIFELEENSLFMLIEVEITINNKKITKINLNDEKLKRKGFNEKVIDEINNKAILLIKEDEEELFNIQDILKIEEVYDLNNLCLVRESPTRIYFRNDGNDYLIINYYLEKESNNLYLANVRELKSEKTIIITQKVLISEKLIKKSNSFRLKHLLKTYN